MKIRFCAALLLAALGVFALTGCQASAMDTLDNLEETIENRLDRAGDAIGRAIEPPATQSATENRITPEEAEAIAFAHAGVNAEDVQRLRIEFDYDDGRPEYEVDFICNGWEYDYEILAVTGEILRSEAETAEPHPSSTAPAGSGPPATEAMAPQDSQPQRLTEEQAREIALKDAGLTMEQVTRLKVEFDYDDGRPEYEVDFHHNGWEYDYEIHAETGKILAQDKDRED